MIVSKIAGAIMFPCIVGLLLGESSHAQNSVRSAESASVEAPLPKDIYPDSRNRLPLPNRDDMDNEGKDAFDELTRKSELPIGIEQPGVRLWDPQLARPMGEVSHYLKSVVSQRCASCLS
jgi:hypothetical protein